MSISKVSSSVTSPSSLASLMCDRVEPFASDSAKTIFEPGCGAGQFLSEVLSRRLSLARTATDFLDSIATLYGADISESQILLARETLREQISSFMDDHSFEDLDYRFWPLVDMFLEHNLVLGDLISGRDKIKFISWRRVSDYHYDGEPIYLSEILEDAYVA